MLIQIRVAARKRRDRPLNSNYYCLAGNSGGGWSNNERRAGKYLQREQCKQHCSRKLPNKHAQQQQQQHFTISIEINDAL